MVGRKNEISCLRHVEDTILVTYPIFNDLKLNPI